MQNQKLSEKFKLENYQRPQTEKQIENAEKILRRLLQEANKNSYAGL